MRKDMHEIIVERPRPGSARHVPRRFRRFDLTRAPMDDDAVEALPSRLGHRRAASLAGDSKSLNENLAPLRRYLEKQVGRPWNKVWSEVSAHLRPANPVQQHVRDHIPDFVAVHTFIRDGVVWVTQRWGGPVPLSSAWEELYVDPRNGLLRRNKAYGAAKADRRKRDAAQAKALAARLRGLGLWRQLHLLDDGNWWEVELALVPVAPAGIVDAIEQAGLSSLPRAERYGRSGVYAVAKRPLSRREIVALKLRD